MWFSAKLFSADAIAFKNFFGFVSFFLRPKEYCVLYSKDTPGLSGKNQPYYFGCYYLLTFGIYLYVDELYIQYLVFWNS